MRSYLVHFAQRHVNFRVPELLSLVSYFGLDGEFRMRSEPSADSPFLEVDLPSDAAAHQLASRCVLMKDVYEFWCSGSNEAECRERLQQLEPSFTRPFFESDASWSLCVRGFGKSLTQSEQASTRAFFSPLLPFRGPVKLRGMTYDFSLFLDYGDQVAESTLKRVYLVRHLASGQRALVDQFSLKKRRFLGPTSMDAELSFIMANMGGCGPSRLTLDPYVGTGSILVACSHFGSRCMGLDIDQRILAGKEGRTLFSNFDQYSLPKPEVVRADFSQASFLRSDSFDSVVCDPPYGIRAGARKSGCRVKEDPVVVQDRATHIPRTQPYGNEEVLVDLLNTSARILRLGGRLVYLLPSLLPFDPAQLPPHPCLRVLHVSEQPLTHKLSRFLITMEKVSAFEDSRSEEFLGVLRRHLSQYDLSFIKDINLQALLNPPPAPAHRPKKH